MATGDELRVTSASGADTTAYAVTVTSAPPICSSGQCSETFEEAGEAQPFTVPDGVASVTFTAIGAGAGGA